MFIKGKKIVATEMPYLTKGEDKTINGWIRDEAFRRLKTKSTSEVNRVNIRLHKIGNYFNVRQLQYQLYKKKKMIHIIMIAIK